MQHLNQLERLIQKRGLKNKILFLLIFFILAIDIGGSWFADVFFCSDELYWGAYFGMKSFESWCFSILLIFLFRYYFNEKINKKELLKWILDSWAMICGADFIDNLLGMRSETTVFDFIAIIVILSNIRHVLWKR